MSSTFAIGDSVYVGTGTDRIGKVAYIGETQFSAGEWIGVILTRPLGKNDGTVAGITYFKCEPLHGIFSKPYNLRLASTVDKCGDTPSDGDQLKNSGSDVEGFSKPDSSIIRSQHTAHVVGERVQVSGGRSGILRYLGPTDFAAGEWAGIELDEPVGKNDGSVGGKRYFTCKPNFGLFASVNKLVSPGSQNATQNLGTPQNRRSQESLLSYCSNLSSVSRSYRAHYAANNQGRTSSAVNRRPTSVQNNSDQKDQTANIQSLQRLVREKEEHINQLLEERDIERSDLARITLDREQIHAQLNSQRIVVEQLNEQLKSMEAANRILQEEHEQLLGKLHEEKKAVEDLQFRMEEEKMNKSTLESINADEESKIFELEEALMFARETNEHTEAELARVREQMAALLANKTPSSETTSFESKGTDMDVKQAAAGIQTVDSLLSFMPKGSQTVLANIELNELLDRVAPDTKDAKVGSPSKISLHRASLVTQTTIPPSSNAIADPTLQTELEKLRRDLADREKITETALRRQAEVLETVSADYEKKMAELNAQLCAASNDLLSSRDECTALKDAMESSNAALKSDLEDLKKRLADEEHKSEEKLLCYKNRISDLTTELEQEKSKTSATVMEQAVALRKLEEKLRLTEHQLLDLQSGAIVHTQVGLDEQRNAVDSVDTTDQSELLELRTRVQSQADDLRAQREQLTALQVTYAEAISERHESDNKIQQLETQLDSVRLDMAEALRKQDELSQSLKLASADRDRLLAELAPLLGGSHPNGDDDDGRSVERLTQGLRELIERLSKQVNEAEDRRSTLENRLVKLEQERVELEQQFSALQSSSNEALTNSSSLSAQLSSARERISCLETSVAAALRNVDAKSVELQSVQAKLDQTQSEHSRLQQSHTQIVASLETEKQELIQRIRSLESTAPGAPISDATSSQQLTQLMEEKASAESQLNFLNSIIVDLHKRNAELEERMRSLLSNVNGNSPKPALSVHLSHPPRRWCDNCLVFDSHDTENCPSARAGNTPHSKAPKQKLLGRTYSTTDRVYCDICGVFDQHPTSACTNNETF